MLKDISELYPNLGRLIDVVLSVWPEHAAYLDKSMEVRTEAVLLTSDRMAAAVLDLAADRAVEHANDYRWLCQELQEEELNFARTGQYRFSTFEETNAHVYSDHDFMRKYMHGLLYSHVLWFMHASSLNFFEQRLAARTSKGGRVLEVGSGHGLLLFLSLRDLGMAEAVAWDLSEVSLEQTREALGRLGALDRARFAVQDMHQADLSNERFDLVILSHLLEHLENPVGALQKVRSVLGKSGLLFVNVPLNAPMPDHLILLGKPDEAVKLMTDGGFNVLEMACHTTQGATLARALKQKTAITCSIIAEPA